ncbi:MAG TPA: hypothetical protein VF868_01410 [Bacteroidia bacterium]|jgi:phosphoglycerol transferase MdoB-like AlkP superfamily enzyme
MHNIADCCLVLLLGTVVFQDLRSREISWFLIPLLFIGFTIKAVLTIPQNDVLLYFLFNSGFVIVQLILLTLYFSLKNHRFTNIINKYLGIGDLLFFLAICTASSPANFIMFFILSMVLILIIYFIYTLISDKPLKEIPLAGLMSAVIICLIGLNLSIRSLSFYDDFYILSLLS